MILALIVALLVWRCRRWAAYLAILAGVLVLLTLYVSGLNYILPIWTVLLGLVLIVAGVISVTGNKYALRSRNLEGQESKPTAAQVKKAILRKLWASMAAPLALWLLLSGTVQRSNLCKAQDRRPGR